MAQIPGEVDNMEGLPASNNNNLATRWESPDRGWEREQPAASTAAASLFECSRIKALADEREAVQKKTFTKWVNSHLARVGCHIGDLYVDLRDGFVLTRLLEVLSGEQLPRPTRGRMRIHSLENVDKALQFLKEQRVHLENVGSHDIVDGNHRLTLGLVWTIILRFQIQVIKIETEDNRETRSAKDALLLWCQMKTAGYPEVNIQNFTTSWRDGLAFNALIHRHRPDLVDFSKLTKSNANYNLQRAFRTAEQHLGLARLLDPEDVNMEAPDEKSIITYVVSFYHYFSKMKALAVEGKRIGKVLDQVLEVGKIIERYEELAAELLAWIHRTVGLISNQKFANSLSGVQQQLQAFTAYCTLEKPVKFQEKGNLEVLLFSIQSKLRACNRRLFVPREGCGIWDIDKAWGELEKAEHEREAALRAELIRQEKLELLAQRFDHKVAMRESWLNENQRLVSQDNFGYELPAVEAAMKKHEAIEADIAAYEERVQGVAELAQALAAEGYYDIRRVAAQRDSVLRQWALLTGLVGARRTRLEQNLALQKVFQEMVYMVDWMEEMQAQLLSPECGQHLVEADDLLQKHGLLEGDIVAQSERVEALNAAALRFSQLQGYQPCDPQVICNRVNHVHGCLAELQEQAARRRAELEASRSLWALLQELEEAESWARDKERLLEAAGGGGAAGAAGAAGTAGGAHDLSSTARLLAQHKILQGELGGRRALLQQALRCGEELVAAGGAVGPGAETVQLVGLAERAASARRRWQRLEEAAARRERRLQEARALHQFGADLDGLLDWLRDAYRLAAAGDFGHDEASSRRLARQHRALTGEVEAHRGPVSGLRRQLATLGGASGAGPLVVALQVRVVEAEQLFAEVTEVAALRRQWLRDALAVYRMFGEVHACELWIGEKEQWLLSMRVPDSLDDVEVVQHRFESLDQEMNSLMGRVLDVNHTVQELVEGGHPSSDEVRSCQDHLNSRWNRIVELVEQRKEEMSAVLLVENHVLEVAEVRAQVREKRRAVESAPRAGGALQWRLSGLEAALQALEPRQAALLEEAALLAARFPAQAARLHQGAEELGAEWGALASAAQACGEAVAAAGRLQRFLHDLDAFLDWLVRAQEAAGGSEGPLPNSLEEADALLGRHAALKEEVDQREEDYARIVAASEALLAADGAELGPGLALDEWLPHLELGWHKLLGLWEARREALVQAHIYQLFLRDLRQALVVLRNQEMALSGAELPGTVESVEEALKQHRDFLTTMELNQQKMQVAVQAAEGLLRQGNIYGEQAQEAVTRLLEKNQENQLRAQQWMQKLHDQLELQHFLRDCHELDGWIHEKMLMARDGTREDSHKLHKRWLRHQAFMAELAQNKEWLEKIEREGQQLMQEKPELAASVRKKLGEIRQCWAELESTTQAKARQLFEASKADQLVQSFAELDKKLLHMESQLQDVDPGGDLATVNSQLKKLQSMESQVEEWYREVGELQAQTAALPLEPASKELVGERQNAVGERLVRLLEPLQERRRLLLASKELHQVAHDLDDELAWVQERLPLAMQTERGNGLQAVQQHIKKNQGLRREIQAHGPRLEEVLERAGALSSLRSPEAEAVRRGLEQLQSAWAGLREAAERRQQALDAAFQVEQYYFDVAEVEAWLGEQELLMMSEDKGKDEQSTLQLLKKHLQLEQGVENYEESIAQLSRQCRALLEMGHPDSEQISRRQSQVDRLYVALKELGEERRVALEQQYWLYQLSRQVSELEHWIAEKEVVAGSPELGQDFEHVSVLQEKFSEFASETGTAGRERLAAVNQMVDELIECGHTAAATMAEWKDGLNEAWAELLELMGTRAQLLAASRELHKFFSDARELQGQIEEKRRRLPRLTTPPEPRPSASSMQRTLRAFEHDLQLLVSQVRQLQEGAAQLRTVYAGEHAEAIASREQEVLQGWKELLSACEDARLHVSSTADALRFHSQVRDLLSWMDGIASQIGAADKPRDVSSVEVLMNYHQGLKTELEARVPELTACQELGRSLLLNKSAMADEIQAQLDKLGTRKEEVSEKWDRHWEWLQQMLEVHQFAQEAVVADAWLTAQEPLLQSRELGSSVDEVEQLIRRHEAFRKAAAAWEERFSSLRRLTTIEKIKAEQSKQPPTPLLGRKFFGDPTELAAKAAPLLRPGGYERGLEPLARRASDTLSAEVRTRVGYVRQELKPERLQPRIDRLPEIPGRVEHAALPASPEDAAETPAAPVAAEQVRPRPERQESADRAEELPRRRRPERQESVDQSEEAARRRRPERQESAEHEAAHSLTLGRYEQMERRRERRERRLERQESSEQEMPIRGDLVKGKATLADIVEQLQEKEAGPGLPAGPSLPQPRELPPGRLPNGLEPPERTPRPDRPRARDRPKPRRRPRPREGGEGGGSRRSRSAPAQGGSAPAPPPPPTHTVQHEGFLLRKRELDANRKSSNRSWVSLYCVLSKGELGFYKDSKGPASGSTHGGEPLLSLHKATSEVASDYKKKKHVFKLQTQDGSEFLLQAKDEEEMNGWLEAVAASVAEHAEIARWGQTLPTTSSTDEGNPKREGGDRRASGRRK
ncbi:spectrin beta chain, non-erythrocytic 4 isoform X1 [Papio anubis]|uniref:Spectrin beta, non-erythrocytic 4 n=2 Tax=Papio anubis TaxID=9555 RepID=A0A0A0MV35_PAPAN|nr:spectrin beta chain, non-erythrocytic 4 isoform X1 [Papio anubis]XP_021786807.1 spectrin beta chain, non-erythrocytic 4 isoform X1 [Papio anubis]XP_021786808.1 spectrin beta chain, non-erythrocytic 4 isoform X1 [Papio anubis]XP_031515309.1 spectrin beta chain, non-erythrocytic 4 isoform X1 [Papio anubis]XP_031515310.1 spectrin beta chain, non-erythrocytic 4 isoform X1 [Papio anubis]